MTTIDVIMYVGVVLALALSVFVSACIAALDIRRKGKPLRWITRMAIRFAASALCVVFYMTTYLFITNVAMPHVRDVRAAQRSAERNP